MYSRNWKVIQAAAVFGPRSIDLRVHARALVGCPGRGPGDGDHVVAAVRQAGQKSIRQRERQVPGVDRGHAVGREEPDLLAIGLKTKGGVKAGVPVEVSVSAYPGETFAGTIAWVADMVNPKTRRVTVRCALPNAQGRLKPEMYATMMLGEGEPRPVVVVPAAAVQDIDGKPVVFVEEGPGRYRRRDVTVGPESGGTVEVRSGLRDGERVVVAGAFLLKSELLKSTTPEG